MSAAWMQVVNPFANPLVVSGIRTRLRWMYALGWGAVVVVITSFIYTLVFIVTGERGQLQTEVAAKTALLPVIVWQGVILMGMGTSAVAWGIAGEKSRHLIDYQRMTPMSPTAKIIGYLFGLPAREYFLFALTMPYVAYSVVVGGIPLAEVSQYYLVFFTSVIVYHMTGLVAGMVSPKPWRAAMAAPAIVFLLYVVIPQLSWLGFSFAEFLTVRPTFYALIAEEIHIYDAAMPINIERFRTVPFYGWELHPTFFSLLTQALLFAALYIVVYRKWHDESRNAFPKWFGLVAYAVAQFMLVGTLWRYFTDLDALAWLGEHLHQVPAGLFPGLRREAIVLIIMLYTFFAISLGLVLILLMTITPTRHGVAKGIRRARKRGMARLSVWSDAYTSFPYGVCFVAITAISYWKLMSLAIESGWYFSSTPTIFEMAAPMLLFAVVAVYLQAFLEQWGARPFGVAMFMLWFVPFFTYVIVIARYDPSAQAAYIAAPAPMATGAYAVMNLFADDFSRAALGDDLAALPQLTRFGVQLSALIALGGVVMLWRRNRKLAGEEWGRTMTQPLDASS